MGIFCFRFLGYKWSGLISVGSMKGQLSNYVLDGIKLELFIRLVAIIMWIMLVPSSLILLIKYC